MGPSPPLPPFKRANSTPWGSLRKLDEKKRRSEYLLKFQNNFRYPITMEHHDGQIIGKGIGKLLRGRENITNLQLVLGLDLI